MLRKWKIIVPLAVTAAGALASGLAVLMQKLPKQEPQAAAPKPVKRRATGVYSFISGFQDAALIELLVDYDPDIYNFMVVEDGFLHDTAASHVALVLGGDFELQLEYALYYGGEDFAAHCAALREKYPRSGDIVCGTHKGLWVLDGDSIAIHFPISGDSNSYLLVTAQKGPDNDAELTTLPDHAPLKELLGTVRFVIK